MGLQKEGNPPPLGTEWVEDLMESRAPDATCNASSSWAPDAGQGPGTLGLPSLTDPSAQACARTILFQ